MIGMLAARALGLDWDLAKKKEIEKREETDEGGYVVGSVQMGIPNDFKRL